MHAYARPVAAILFGLTTPVVARPVAAQAAPVLPLRWEVEAGPSFPSGGTFNDVYKAGYHAGVLLGRALSDRVALRAAAAYDLFGHNTLEPRYGEDGRRGIAFDLRAEALYGGQLRGRELYVIGGAGYYRVRSAFLALSGRVLPASTQQSFGVDGGVGMRLGSAWRLEIRHHDAFRKRWGIARWIPVTLGYTF